MKNTLRNIGLVGLILATIGACDRIQQVKEKDNVSSQEVQVVDTPRYEKAGVMYGVSVNDLKENIPVYEELPTYEGLFMLVDNETNKAYLGSRWAEDPSKGYVAVFKDSSHAEKIRRYLEIKLEKGPFSVVKIDSESVARYVH